MESKLRESTLRKLSQDCIVLTADGIVARVDKLTFGRGQIRLVDCNDEEHWLPSDTMVAVIATAEEALQQFLVSKQKEYERPKPKYDVVMPWYEAHALRQMVAESPEAVLALFAQRYPPDQGSDRDRPRKFGSVARLASLHGDMLTVDSWQQIVLVDGQYRLDDDEGARTVQLTPLERTF